MSTTLRSLIACVIVVVAAHLAFGQNEATRQPEATQQTETTEPARTTADENFELNISERRITRSNFAASTSVEAGEESARGLNLRVGVEIGTGRIELLLRNVRGQVRFRATLERVLDRINARKPSNASP